MCNVWQSNADSCSRRPPRKVCSMRCNRDVTSGFVSMGHESIVRVKGMSCVCLQTIQQESISVVVDMT